VRCIQTRDMNFQGSTCICRVPKASLKKGTVVECPHCGELLEPCPESRRIAPGRCADIFRVPRLRVDGLSGGASR
jgi:hypothetical protein